MFCPRCGSTQTDELKFCKACGANLQAVRQVVDTKDTEQKFDSSNTWMAAVREQIELERQQGLTPEVKRYNEIKAGVITSCAGLALSVLLLVLMQGIVLSGNVSSGTAEILSRLWIAGVIPLFVGVALIINGLVVSRKLVELARRDLPPQAGVTPRDAEPELLRPADTNEFIPSSLSVTEGTTRHLKSSRHE